MSLFNRSSGVLLHITSLPSKYGIGTLGKEAYEFVDFLSESNQKIWQILPLTPTSDENCPYDCFSAFAGNPYVICLEKLVQDNMLKESDLPKDENIIFKNLFKEKDVILKKAFLNLNIDKIKFNNFCIDNEYWLLDYSLFISLMNFFNKSWNEWPDDIREKTVSAVNRYSKLLNEDIQYNNFLQFIFFQQWNELKDYANSKDIKIIGDVPIYLSFNSADVWAHKDVFLLDINYNPIKVSGVPPDYFSQDGQLWGHPLYNWKNLKNTNFEWWVKRFQFNYKIFDIIRIDHFIAFSQYWAVPFGEKTARNGSWFWAYGRELFQEVKNQLGEFPTIVEDLGYITQDAMNLRDDFGFIGTRVLQFNFNFNNNDIHCFPNNFPSNCVLYTGTHDNDTIMGWYHKEYNKDLLKYYLNYYSDSEINWEFIRSVFQSNANIVIIPLQDILGTDSSTRMNIPGKLGQWKWRYNKMDLTIEMINKLKLLTSTYNR